MWILAHDRRSQRADNSSDSQRARSREKRVAEKREIEIYWHTVTKTFTNLGLN